VTSLDHDTWAAQIRLLAIGCGEAGRREAEAIIEADAEIGRKLDELNGSTEDQ